jgi:hypothetical protein
MTEIPHLGEAVLYRSEHEMGGQHEHAAIVTQVLEPAPDGRARVHLHVLPSSGQPFKASGILQAGSDEEHSVWMARARPEATKPAANTAKRT